MMTTDKDMNSEIKDEPSDIKGNERPWKELLAEYSKESTLHGIKYLTESGQGFLPRKIFWSIVMLASTTVMLFFVSYNLFKYYSYPKLVNVEINYVSQLLFPAVTLCPQNFFRVTSLQRHGLYDTIRNVATSSSQNHNLSDPNQSTDTFHLVKNICTIPVDRTVITKSVIIYNETTKTVCGELCMSLHDEGCSSVLYDAKTRSCVLSVYAGRVQELDKTCSNTTQFYKRVRNLNAESVFCELEDSSVDRCPFRVDTSGTIQWNMIQAEKSTGVTQDHTLGSGSGYVLELPATDLYPHTAAYYTSSYLNTSGLCLEFYYQIWAESGTSIDIVAISEDWQEFVLATVHQKYFTDSKWKYFLTELPDGIYKVVLKGKRQDGVNGCALDDITIIPCEQFYLNCRRSQDGLSYLGNVHISHDGEQCLDWVHDTRFSDDDFGDKSKEHASNFCRNPDLDTRGPWCRTSQLQKQYCDVDFCVCRPGQYRCDSGRCIPGYLTCNGVDDCGDLSDEMLPCVSSQTLECEFEDLYLCGYTQSVDSIGRWKRHRGTADNLVKRPKRDSHGSSLGHYLLMSTVGLVKGDIGWIVSSFLDLKRSTSLTIDLYFEAHPLDTTASLKINKYSTEGMFQSTLLVIQPFLGSHRINFTSQTWKNISFCLPQGQYKIGFEATLGEPFYSAIAIDNLRESINNDSCINNTMSNITSEVPTIVLEDSDEITDCFAYNDGSDYDGNISVTETGQTCQRWDSITPHLHFEDPERFPEGSLSEAHNFCRNPSGKARPWCYTLDPNMEWDYCKIYKCPNECLLSKLGLNYTGKMDRTITGVKCQRWDSQTPKSHSSDLGDNSLHNNYCRNPVNNPASGGVWCYTLDDNNRWDYCDVPLCNEDVMDLPPATDCKWYPDGKDYIGSLNTTVSNYTCQMWISTEPHDLSTVDVDLPERLRKDKNYCRKLDDDFGFGCLTTDPDVFWDECYVPMCQDSTVCHWAEHGEDYLGTVNTTVNGRTCQRWNSNYPHTHYYWSSYFADGSIDAAENYCRNPDGVSQPWCFTTDPGKRWEYCDVKRCDLSVLYPPEEAFPINIELEQSRQACYMSEDGRDYLGGVSVTHDGFQCQRWDSQLPHTHTLTAEDFLEQTLTEAGNYCRNPGGDGLGPWCYTNDTTVKWQYCDIHQCTGVCYHSMNGVDFIGNLYLTASHRVCRNWTVTKEQHAAYFLNITWTWDDEYLVDNFCRNPSSSARPWCYVYDLNADPEQPPEWEWCHLTRCDVGCYNEPKGTDFRGEIRVTETGLRCVNWSDVLSSTDLIESDFPDSSVLAAQDFCRNPGGSSSRPWCYVDEDLSWDYCLVPECPQDLLTRPSCRFEEESMCDYVSLLSTVYSSWKRIPKSMITQAFQLSEPGESCSMLHYTTEGNIISRGYPLAYPENSFCNDTILTPGAALMNITTIYLSVENSPSCAYDNVTIFDTELGDEWSGTTLCGEKKFNAEDLAGDSLSVIFQSDKFKQAPGYHINYKTSDVPAEDYALILLNSFPAKLPRVYKTSLVTPPIQPLTYGCLTFELLTGNTDISFKVKLVTGWNKDRLLFHSNKSTEGTWKKYNVDIGQQSSVFYVVFEATVTGDLNGGIMAVDNVNLMLTDCFGTHQVAGEANCGFDTSCGYITPSYSRLRWVRQSGRADNDLQRPLRENSDNTLGKYLVLDTKAAQPGDLGVIISPVLHVARPTYLTFDLYMESVKVDVSTFLTVSRMSEFGTDPQVLAHFGPPLAMVENQWNAKEWRKMSVCIPPGDYRLGFTGSVGQSEYTTIALDNVMVDGTECSLPDDIISNVDPGNNSGDATDCYNTRTGQDYMGRQNYTVTGTACQRWDSQSPQTHNSDDWEFLEGNLATMENFCRNPQGRSERPWCYTMNPDSRWEYCDLTRCQHSTNCYQSSRGLDYTGSQFITSSGEICEAWSNIDNDTLAAAMIPGIPNVSLDANFCRNPNNRSKPWCFIEGDTNEWELCDIPLCDTGCHKEVDGTDYTGSLNISQSGRICINWDQFPEITDFGKHGENYPDNYCRNPGGMRDHPWCYVYNDTGVIIWEYCDTAYCPADVDGDCSFENFDVCGYTSLNSSLRSTWKRIPRGDVISWYNASDSGFECAYHFYETSGSIQSPDFPASGSSWTSCQYDIHVPAGGALSISINYLNVWKDSGCTYASFQIQGEQSDMNLFTTPWCGQYERSYRYTAVADITLLFTIKYDHPWYEGFQMDFSTSDVPYVDYAMAFIPRSTSDDFKEWSLLVSPPLGATPASCLELDVCNPSASCTLTVQTLTDNVQEMVLAHIIGGVHSDWHTLSIDVPDQKEVFKIVLWATASAPNCIVAVDNIQLHTRECWKNEIADTLTTQENPELNSTVTNQTIATTIEELNVSISTVTLNESHLHPGLQVDELTDIILGHPMGELSIITSQIEETDFDMTSFLMEAGHQREDLIFRAYWGGEQIEKEEFLPQYTDMGLCYTFNHNASHKLNSEVKGAAYGLRLLLNTEQYEHTDTLNSGTGVKVQVRPQDDVTNVKDLGFVVGAGFYSLGAIDYEKSVQLGHPYGTCGGESLDYFPRDNYTLARCMVQCSTQQFEKICHCRTLDMPGPEDVCEIQEYVSCFIQGSNSREGVFCDCPDACESDLFEIELSFARMSKQDPKRFFTHNEYMEIKSKLANATEIHQRVNSDSMFQLLQAIDNTLMSLHAYDSYFMRRVVLEQTSIIHLAEAAISSIKDMLRNDLEAKLFGTLDTIDRSYRVHLKSKNSAGYMAIRDMRMSLRRINGMLGLISEKSQTANSLSLQNAAGDFRRNRNFTILILDDIYNIDTLLDGYLPHNIVKNKNKQLQKCRDHEISLTNLSMKILELADSIWQADISVNNSNITDTIQQCDWMPFPVPEELEAMYVLRASMARDIDYPDSCQLAENISSCFIALTATERCISQYEQELDTFHDWMDQVHLSFKLPQFREGIDQRKSFYLEQQPRLTAWLHNLRAQFVEYTGDLESLSSIMLSTEVEEVLQHIAQSISITKSSVLDPLLRYLADLNNDLVDFYVESLVMIKEFIFFFEDEDIKTELVDGARAAKIWKEPSIDGTAFKYIRYNEESVQSWPKSQGIENFLETNGPDLVDMLVTSLVEGIEDILRQTETDLVLLQQDVSDNVNTLRDMIGSLMQSTDVDEEFIQQNFLALDLYYTELKYLLVEQKPAYGQTEFWSEFGGFLGLLLGASVLTVVEFLDFIMSNWTARIKKKQTQDAANSNNIAV